MGHYIASAISGSFYYILYYLGIILYTSGMNIRTFFWTSEIVVSVIWVLFFLTVVFTNPFKSQVGVFAMFFTTLFCGLSLSWCLLELRMVIKKQGYDLINHKLFNAARHGLMFATICVGLLFMTAVDIFTVFDGLIFMIAVLLIEAYFLARRPVIQISSDDE